MGNPAETQHGYMLIGLMLNVVLLGIMVTQLYIYYTTYKRDRTWMKVYVRIVAYLFIADSLNSVFVFVYLYTTLIVRFGDNERLFIANWVFASGSNWHLRAALLCMASAHFDQAMENSVLGSRLPGGCDIYHVRRYKLRLSFLMRSSLTILAFVVSGVLSAYEASRHPKFEDFKLFNHTVSTWLAASAACDLLITSILVFATSQAQDGIQAIRSYDRPDQQVLMPGNDLSKVIMQTGLLTMIIAVLDLILFLVSPTGLHLVFNYTLSKLYTNSLMSTLNARHVTSNGSGAHTDTV
ncbi:hypothetical protein BKA70DRAFT_1401486 [Coprinopsis sp. MPI-PUGE-AT-0042]|nr:hypothetical protein BKA70DRAFT_1401486 [Coprinopsis sp. MPI-PUGE-AT-0042]